MKKLKWIIGIAVILAMGSPAWGQTVSANTGQYFTIIGAVTNGGQYIQNNSIIVPPNESVALVSFASGLEPSLLSFSVVTPTVSSTLNVSATSLGLNSPCIIAGPATITNIFAYSGPNSPLSSFNTSFQTAYALTYKYIPQTADVNKTLIIPPGTNNICVRLQSSTDLVNWYDATNGLYGGTNVAMFFRINLQSSSQ